MIFLLAIYFFFPLELSKSHNKNTIPPPNNIRFPKPLPPPLSSQPLQTPQLPPLLQYLQELQVVHALQLFLPVQRPANISFVKRMKIITML